MGEYWKPVNLTKREYIHPHDMDDGLKLGEWTYPKSATMNLINKRWSSDDVVIYVSDYDGLMAVRGEPTGKLPTYDSLDEDGFKRVSEP